MHNITRKIDWWRGKKLVVVLFSILILITILVIFFPNIASGPLRENVNGFEEVTHVSIREAMFSVIVADTEEERVRGLSDTALLEEENGILFVFPNPSIYGFWMKDMSYGIDIIWISSDNRVAYIKHDARPELYPEVYQPFVPAQYVLEINSGLSAQYNFEIGDKVLFLSL